MQGRLSNVPVPDEVAHQTVADLRRFAGEWWKGGPSAVETTIRNDPTFSFALLDSRRGAGGCIKLVTARSYAPPGMVDLQQPMGPGTPYMTIVKGDMAANKDAVIFSFCISATQEHLIAVHGHGPFLLVADPALSNIAVGPTGDVFVDDVAKILTVTPREQIWPPSYVTEPIVYDEAQLDTWPEGATLLEILDTAARMLDGRLSFIAGARAIGAHYGKGTAALDADGAIRTMYDTDAQIADPRGFQRMAAEPGCEPEARGGSWPLRNELARVEKWARERCEHACVTLIHRFRGSAFA